MNAQTPAWVMDAGELRTLLDNLSSALKTSPSVRGALEPLSLIHDTSSTEPGFVQRALSAELQPETTFNDVKVVLDLLLSADAALAEAVGLDPGPGEEEEG